MRDPNAGWRWLDRGWLYDLSLQKEPPFPARRHRFFHSSQKGIVGEDDRTTAPPPLPWSTSRNKPKTKTKKSFSSSVCKFIGLDFLRSRIKQDSMRRTGGDAQRARTYPFSFRHRRFVHSTQHAPCSANALGFAGVAADLKCSPLRSGFDRVTVWTERYWSRPRDVELLSSHPHASPVGLCLSLSSLVTNQLYQGRSVGVATRLFSF